MAQTSYCLTLPAALACAGLLAVTGGARAADASLSASYAVSIGGFALAKSNFVLKVEKDRYVARVGYRVTGMGKIVSSAKGEVTATGALKPDRAVPASYKLDAQGAKPSQATMALASGSVTSLDLDPPPKPDPERIPVAAEHRRDIVDPVSALLIPVKSKEGGAAVCQRTLPIFDGWSRYDVKLSYKSSDPVQKTGFSGEAVTCSARWVPISGHKPDKPGTKFMTDNKEIEISLAPVGDSGVWAPVRVSIMTMSGLLLVEAERFEAAAEDTQRHAAN